MSVGRHGIGVRDQLLHSPVILQCLAELGHIQQAEGIGPLHDLIQVIPHAPHLLDQHRYIGGRGLLHLRAVQDAAAVTLAGQAGLAGLLGKGIQFRFGKTDPSFQVFFSKQSSFLNAGS